MEILFISPSYKPAFCYGGPTLSVSRLAETLTENQLNLIVFTTTANGNKELEVPTSVQFPIDGVKCYFYHRWTKDHSHFSPRLLWALIWKLKRGQIVHIHSWWNWVVMPSVLLCWIFGIRPILSTRGMVSTYTLKNKYKQLFHHYIGGWLLNKTILHATTQKEADEALKLIPNWQYFILPNIINFPSQWNINKLKQKKIYNLVFLSRIDPVKGLESLFTALSKIDIPFQLEIIGDGDKNYIDSLKEMSQKLLIDSYIYWLGWKDGVEKFELLASSDIFVLPSQSENFANTVIESLSVGTPVILSENVGLSDYVNDHNLGWVYSGNDIELPHKLRQAWFDSNKREEIRQRAPFQVRKDFGVEALAQKYIAAYQKFCS